MLNVALLGCGTVGSQVAILLLDEADRIAQQIGVRLQLSKILVRDGTILRDVPRALLTDRADLIINDPEIHPHDLATILDQKGIAVRVGHHCAQPLMRKYEVVGTVRASFYIYNSKEEIDCLVDGLNSAKQLFGRFS